MEMRYFVGLDLGQAQEFTALAVLERRWVAPTDPPEQRRPPYALRHSQRFPPGTPYADMVETVRELLRTPPLPRSILLVDQTGVGRSVVNLLMDGLRDRVTCQFWPVVIKAGRGMTMGEGGEVQVARQELIGALQILLQSRRLQIPRSLPDAALLVEELQNFRAKVTAATTDTLEAWRERENDDLVLAMALACWAGELSLPPL
jgi:hypothetical protein